MALYLTVMYSTTSQLKMSWSCPHSGMTHCQQFPSTAKPQVPKQKHGGKGKGNKESHPHPFRVEQQNWHWEISLPFHSDMTVLSHSIMSDSATPWTIAHQGPLSMGFSRQEYWSGLPCTPPRDLPDPRSNSGLLHCRQILYCLSHQEGHKYQSG